MKNHKKLRAANNVHLTKLNGFLNPSPTSRIDRNLTTKFLNIRELMNAPTDKGRMSRYVHQRNPTKVHSTTVEDKGTNSQSFVKFVLAHQSIGAKWIAFFRKWYENFVKRILMHEVTKLTQTTEDSFSLKELRLWHQIQISASSRKERVTNNRKQSVKQLITKRKYENSQKFCEHAVLYVF